MYRTAAFVVEMHKALNLPPEALRRQALPLPVIHLLEMQP